jgi:hypothetical protein
MHDSPTGLSQVESGDFMVGIDGNGEGLCLVLESFYLLEWCQW